VNWQANLVELARYSLLYHHTDLERSGRHRSDNIRLGDRMELDADPVPLPQICRNHWQDDVCGNFAARDAEDRPAACRLAPHRGCSFLGEAKEACTLAEQNRACVGERGMFRRPVEEALPELVFQPTHGLADGWLRAIELRGGA
jgi:hypothetical protein